MRAKASISRKIGRRLWYECEVQMNGRVTVAMDRRADQMAVGLAKIIRSLLLADEKTRSQDPLRMPVLAYPTV